MMKLFLDMNNNYATLTISKATQEGNAATNDANFRVELSRRIQPKKCKKSIKANGKSSDPQNFSC